ncbi:MAG: hypothetical protein WC899_12130 [bacterium]|jgi:hypothetical protein
MRVKIVGILVLLMLTTLWNNARSADPPPPQFFGAYSVELKVGEIFIISKSNEIIGPLSAPICDDLRIVSVVDTPDGPAFNGIAPGKTLCSMSSAAGGLGKRRVFSITVHEK